MYRRVVNFIHNILLAPARLGTEAAVWRGSEKYVYDEKSLAKFQQRRSFFS